MLNIRLYDNYNQTQGLKKIFMNEKEVLEDTVIIMINREGDAVLNMRGLRHRISGNNMLILGPKREFWFSEISDDFKADIYKVGVKELEMAAKDTIGIHLGVVMFERPVLYLTYEQAVMSHNVFKYVKKLLERRETHYRNLCIMNYVKMYFYEACDLLLGVNTKRYANTKASVMTQKFIGLLEINVNRLVLVKQYAELMNVTPKYLSAVVKASTGRRPQAWIDEYRVLQAKNYLKGHEMSIQEIALHMNFSSPSHFSKFFKLQTGQTPKEYVNGL